MSPRLVWRKSVSVMMLSLTGVCALAGVSVLLFILGYLLWYGGKYINWDFVTQLPKPVGETGGGMANAIVGSAKLLLLAALTGVPVGFFGGVGTDTSNNAFITGSDTAGCFVRDASGNIRHSAGARDSIATAAG